MMFDLMSRMRELDGLPYWESAGAAQADGPAAFDAPAAAGTREWWRSRTRVGIVSP